MWYGNATAAVVANGQGIVIAVTLERITKKMLKCWCCW